MYRKIEGKRVYSVHELADYFGVKPQTLIRWYHKIAKHSKGDTAVISDALRGDRYLTDFIFQKLLSEHGDRVKVDLESEIMGRRDQLERLKKALTESLRAVDELLN